MADYEIFISCKSEDYEIAESVYSYLLSKGFRVFLSSKELRRLAKADYIDAISSALDTSNHLIVVSTKKEYVNSKWVKFEWSTFLNELLSGRKTGQIMTLLDGIRVDELPISLRKFESFTLQNYENVILPYIETFKDSDDNYESIRDSANADDSKKSEKPIIERKYDSVEVHIETDIACRVMHFNNELTIARPGEDSVIYLKKGVHKLSFVSIENKQDKLSLVYTAKDDCEILQVELAKIRSERIVSALKTKEETERKAKEKKQIDDKCAQYKIYWTKKWFSSVPICGYKENNVIVIPAKYDFGRKFQNGFAAVKLGDKWGYIDLKGKEICAIKYDYASCFSEDMARVGIRGMYGFIDKTGKEVIPLIYEEAANFNEGFAMVKINDKYGFIDKSGKVSIPFEYDFAGYFFEGLACVVKNGKYGFIDKKGKVVIPFKFNYAKHFCKGFAEVLLNGKWGKVDKVGNFTLYK